MRFSESDMKQGLFTPDQHRNFGKGVCIFDFLADIYSPDNFACEATGTISLPDQPYFSANHPNPDHSQTDIIKEFNYHIHQVAHENSMSSRKRIYTLLTNHCVMNTIDLLIDTITDTNPPPYPYLYPFCQKLITESHDRGPIQAGIILTSLMRKAEDIPAIEILALHPEFTPFTIIALENICDVHQPLLFSLCKRAVGLARIHLAASIVGHNAVMNDWLIRQGVNGLSSQYHLAYYRIIRSLLAGILKPAHIDSQLYHIMGRYMLTLIDHSADPSFTITETDREIIQHFLRHAARHGIDNNLESKLKHSG